MPVTRVAATGTNTTATDLVLTRPTAVSGDLLLCTLSTGAELTYPAGWSTAWTRIGRWSTSGTIHELYYRFADGTEPASYTFSVAGAKTGTMVSYRGVYAARPFGPPLFLASNSNTQSLTFRAPPVHLHSATKVVAWFTVDYAASSWEQIGPPPELTTAYQHTANHFDTLLADGDFSAGTTPVLVPTRTLTSLYPYAVTIALIPADRPWDPVDWRDFSTHVAGTWPTGLSRAWYSPSSARTDSVVTAGTDKAAQLTNSLTERFMQDASSGELHPLAAPFEITHKLRVTAGTGFRGGLNFCATGTTTTTRNGYFLILDGTTGRFLLYRLASDTATQIGDTGVTGTNNTWYWYRIRHSGTRVYAKVWTDGSAEPGAWQIDIAEATYTSGMWGPGSRTTGATLQTDALGLSTNPTTYPAPTTAPVAPAGAETLSPPSIRSAEAIGPASISVGPPPAQTLSPAGVPSAAGYGVAFVLIAGPAQTVNPPGIASTEAVPPATVTVIAVAQTLNPIGIPSEADTPPIAIEVAPLPPTPGQPPPAPPSPGVPPGPTQRALTYRVWTTDLLTQTPLCHSLPITIDSYTRGLFGSPGTFSGSIPLDAPEDPLPLLKPRRTALWVDVNGRLAWGGMVMPVEPDLESRTLNVQAKQFFGYYEHREIRQDHSYRDVDQLEIARALMTYTHPFWAPPIGFTYNNSGVLLDMDYRREEGTSVFEAITTLADGDPGFDIAEDYYYDAAKRPRVTVKLGYPSLGSTLTGPSFILPGNVVTYRWPVDPARAVNSFVAIGKGSLRESGIDTFELDTGYPLMEGNSGGDYTNVTSRSRLASHARAGLALNKRDRVVPVLTVRTDLDPVVGTYREGDRIRVQLSSAYHRPTTTGGPGYDGTLRMISLEVKPEDATVTITCQEVIV